MPHVDILFVDFECLPVPVQDSILEQATWSFTTAQALSLRLVCKLFDKRIRRLIFGHGLVDLWATNHHILDKDVAAASICLYEVLQVDRKTGRIHLIEYVKSAIESTTRELMLNTEEERERITRIVCDTIAAARSASNGSDLHAIVKQQQLQWNGIPLPLAAALNLQEVIKAQENSHLQQMHPVFGESLVAAAYQGHEDTAVLIMRRMGHSRFMDQAWLRAMRLAVERDHERTIRRLVEYAPMELAGTSVVMLFYVLRFTVQRRNTRMFHVFVDILGGWRFFHTKLSYLPTLMIEAVHNEAYGILRAMLEYEHIGQHLHMQCIELGYCVGCNAIGVGIRAAVSYKNDGPLRVILEHGYHPDTLPTGEPATQDILNNKTPLKRGGVPDRGLASEVAGRVSTLRLLHRNGADMTLNLIHRLKKAVENRKHEQLSFYAEIRNERFNAQAFDEAVELALDRGPFWLDCAKALLPHGANTYGVSVHDLWSEASPECWDRALASSPIAELDQSKDNPDMQSAEPIYHSEEGIGSLRWWRDVRQNVYCALRFKPFVLDWNQDVPINDQDDLNSKQRRTQQKSRRHALRSDQVMLERQKPQVQPYGFWCVL